MEWGKELLKSIIGGFLISIGGTCYLSLDNKVLGAFMFSLGLLAICATNQNLFTGKSSYTIDTKNLICILFGNTYGAIITGTIITAVFPNLQEKALMICQNKLDEGFRLIPLAIFCNIMIYFGVEGYKKGETILLIMCVMSFILCGFEHCIANIYYLSVARIISVKAILYIICNILCNYVGGWIVYIFRKYFRK